MNQTRSQRRGFAAPFPLVIQFDYGACASPYSAGLSIDQRRLAFGFRKLRLHDPATGVATEIDFSSRGNSGGEFLFGFAQPEEWGMWSVGLRSALVVWIDGARTSALEMTLEGAIFPGVGPELHMSVATNVGHRAEFSAQIDHAVTSISLPFDGVRGRLPYFHFPVDDRQENNCSLIERRPVVSIIILNYNHATLALLSALSVIASGITVAYEVLIVDNGSWEDAAALTELKLPVRIVRLQSNRFFGEGNNLGADAARGEYLLFLNNDAFLDRGCVDALLKCFIVEPMCGVAGPVFYYPGGDLQEAGAFVNPDGTSVQRGKHTPFDVDFLLDVNSVDYVSGACLMLRADDFAAVGGFNYRFDPAYYEDVDLCFRLRSRGKTAVIAGAARCLHIENATAGEVGGSFDMNALGDHNRHVFVSTWAGYLQSRTRSALPVPLDIHFASSTGMEEPTQAAFSPYALVPGGGVRYALASTLALGRKGVAALFGSEPCSKHRLRNVMTDLGLQPGAMETRLIDSLGKTRIERGVEIGLDLCPTGSLPARRSFFVCHSPDPAPSRTESEVTAALERFSLIEKVIVPSNFVRARFEAQLARHGREAVVEVVYPPVFAGLPVVSEVRQPWILSVGTFSAQKQKMQGALIEAVKMTSPAFRKEWKLILCGGAPNDRESRDYFRMLRESVGDSVSVEFLVSPTRAQLHQLMTSSAAYASAGGIGVREEVDLWRCEHLGIAMMEALAAGCDLIACEMGVGAEIITRTGCGRSYSTLPELSHLLETTSVSGIGKIQQEEIAAAYGDDAFTARFLAAIA